MSLWNPGTVLSVSRIKLKGRDSVVFRPERTEKSVLIVSVSIPNRDLPITRFSWNRNYPAEVWVFIGKTPTLPASAVATEGARILATLDADTAY